MHDQPKYEPLEPSTFFEDGRASRPLVEGTVARGQLREDLHFYTGKMGQGQPPTIGAQPAANGQPAGQPAGGNQQGQPTGQDFASLFPFPITRDVIDRGEERYNIYCSVCHDRTGTGLGMVVRRGYRQPPSFHIDRLRQAPAGYFFDVITNGFGAMPDYSTQISPRDRWAIVAYIRALQLSQRGTITDVPSEEQQRLKQGAQQQGAQPGGHQ